MPDDTPRKPRPPRTSFREQYTAQPAPVPLYRRNGLWIAAILLILVLALLLWWLG